MNNLFPISLRLRSPSFLWRRFGVVAATLLGGAIWACAFSATLVYGTPSPPPPTLPNGVAAGDVAQESAVLWARSLATGVVTFSYGTESAELTQIVTRTVTDPSLPVTATVHGLLPGTAYHYHVAAPDGSRASGRFRTPAQLGERRGLRFGASGDWRGELSPYPALANATARDLDFFIGLGDTIYADFPSPAVPDRATTLEEFRLKHSEVYTTRFDVNIWAELRGAMGIYMVNDDHEVVNDFAGGANAASDERFPEVDGWINDTQIFEDGMRAFHEYNPLGVERYGVVEGDGRMDGEYMLYRYRLFGSDAALIVLDSRSFRDEPLTALDYTDPRDIRRFVEESYQPGRTMLGEEQVRLLQADLLDAHRRGVLWKFVAVPEPIQNLGPANAEDRFEGYAAERTEILRFIMQHGIQNVVFVAADIHGVIVNNLTYQAGPGEPQTPTSVFEVTTGPVAFDAPFGPTAVQYGVDLGIIPPDLFELYASLPVAVDSDTELDDKDDFIRFTLNQQLRVLGYDTVGLADTDAISATLVQGDYLAVHHYGWTEFDIASDSGLLTVTAYGVPAYTAAEMENDPAGVYARPASVISQFIVQPTRSTKIHIPIIKNQ